jgi:hypothetical protein
MIVKKIKSPIFKGMIPALFRIIKNKTKRTLTISKYPLGLAKREIACLNLEII